MGLLLSVSGTVVLSGDWDNVPSSTYAQMNERERDRSIVRCRTSILLLYRFSQGFRGLFIY